MGIKHKYVATGTNDTGKQVSLNRWNDDHEIDSHLEIPVENAPTPASDRIAIYGKKVAGRVMLAQQGPSNSLEQILQPHLGSTKVAAWVAPGSSASPPGLFGMNGMSAIGTATTRTISASSTMLLRMGRIGYVSSAAPGSLGGIREAITRVSVGAGGGLGGFFLRQRFACSDAAVVSGARMFVGLSNNVSAPTNIEPDTMVNSIGLAQLSTSGNLQLLCAGTLAQPTLDLGAAFPAGTVNADVYELALYAPANEGYVYWQVTRLNTGDVAQGTITDNLPNPQTLMGLQNWRSNNAQSLAVGLDLCSIYLETDY